MAAKIRVGVNGYGVIGKRVADAVSLQDDMEIAGVTFNHLDYRIRVAAEKGYPIYTGTSDQASGDIPLLTQGTFADLIDRVDIMVDCTVKGVAGINKNAYEKAGIKAIFQGGEKHELTGISFTAQVNYEEALYQQFVRVVSCNTTGLCRIMNALHKQGWVKKARAVLMRRATDPWESHKSGLINTMIPETKIPSHQGPDVRSVIKGLNIVTMAGTVPENLSHIHYVMVETTRTLRKEEVCQALWEEPRIAFIRSDEGLVALNSVIELMRDLGRPRNDLWEVAVWEDALTVSEDEIYLVFQVHNEAITVPETIDAIRAMTGIETDGRKSIEKTDRALGITKSFLSDLITHHSTATYAVRQ
jgi:glyceraldehyde-3-phosphate dehydrogenase (NAD(P))